MFKEYTNCKAGNKYAQDIASGKIVSNIYIKAVCERYLKDIESPGDNYYFNFAKAERYLKLVQKFKHTVGKWDTSHIKYEPWQCFFWMNVIGWYSKETGERKYRTSHLEISRGNSKSTMASQAALYFMRMDSPVGNHVACAATRREQARIVLDSARNMALTNTDFLKSTGVRVLAHQIVHTKSDSHIRAISADHSGLDGRADVLTICDELHAMQKKTFETLESGMSKRRDSHLLCITTAGYDVEGIGFSQSCYAKKISLGEIQDDTFFAAVYCIDEKDDPFDENVWIKANPNFGVSVDPVNFRAKALKAKENPQDLANFKIKHLNIWVSEAHAFFDINKWDSCINRNIRLEDFANEKCFVGIDIASKVDLTSFGLIFKRGDKYFIFTKSYIPEVTVRESKNSIYPECVGKGFLISTPGEAISYSKIEGDLLSLSRQHRMDTIFYDPWNSAEFAQNMAKQRLNMVEFRMNVANMSEPMKTLDAYIRAGKIVHDGNPLMRWCMSNVVAKEDHNGNVYPRKSHEKLKIDPVVATLMALAGFLQQRETQSIYEERGILSL